MSQRRGPVTILLGLLLCNTGTAAEPAGQPVLQVGTKEAPPFAMKDAEGDWYGISVELWKYIATQLEWPFEVKELPLKQLLAGVEDRSLDAAVAALTVTEERERLFDFSHPFYTTGLAIAIHTDAKAPWVAALQRLLSAQFLAIVGALGLVLFGVGFLVWLFERRKNGEQFGGTTLEGVGSAFWWSAVTMTTVGYGDKAPRTLGGRVVGLLWMFAAIIIISSFTAAITSALTVSELGSPIQGPEDLPGVRVASVAATTAEEYLKDKKISYQAFPEIDRALQALEERRVDAVVHDAPILKYLAKKRYPETVAVLKNTFLRQDYAIMLPEGSSLREPLNRELIRVIRSAEWKELLYRYQGTTD